MIKESVVSIVQAIMVIKAGGIIVVNACETGFFGPKCQYKCHCQKTECDRNGDCFGDLNCQTGWFGLGCQYKDLAALATTVIKTRPLTDDMSWMTDNYDDTCNSDPYIQALTVTLGSEHLFTWLQFTVRDTGPVRSMNLTFGRLSNLTIHYCDHKNILEVSEQIFEIHCNSREPITHVTLAGEDVIRLCSFHLSGGHSINIQMEIFQSPELFKQGDNVTYPKGDDSINASDHLPNMCSFSSSDQPFPSAWTIIFPTEYIITRYVLHYREGQRGSRLQRIKVETFSSSNKTLAEFSVNITHSKLLQEVLNNEHIHPVRHIKLSLHPDANENETRTMITLCGLEIFGECVHGTWGLECQGCHNCYNGYCLRDTGLCFHGCLGYNDPPQCSNTLLECSHGSWGHSCERTCSENCVNMSGTGKNGLCDSGCEGYSNPPDCTRACKKTRWGINCTNVCTATCKFGVCDSLTGRCTLGCEKGYHSMDCSQVSTEIEEERVALKITLVALIISLILMWIFIIWSFKTKDKQRNVTDTTFYNEDTMISVEELDDFMNSQHETLFVRQFKQIEEATNASRTAALFSKIRKKKGDINFVPYDHSNVLEFDSKKKKGDIINASFLQIQQGLRSTTL